MEEGMEKMSIGIFNEAEERKTRTNIMEPSSMDSSFKEEEQKVKRRRRKRVRVEGEEMKKRRLSEEQVKHLELSFWKERKLESGRKVQLAVELGIDAKQVAVWFQNRRARSKSKQMEEEYVKLKSHHESILQQKCQLEGEILNLRGQLSQAEEEIRKLISSNVNGVVGGSDGFSVGGGGGEMSSCCSRSTGSFSIDNNITEGFNGGGVGMAGEEEELVYINEYNAYANMLMTLHGMW